MFIAAMPKSKGKNAFFFFMLDWKAQQEKKYGIILTIKSVQSDPKCSEAWRNLSNEKKAYYKEMAKNDKFLLQVEKKTTTGELMAVIEKENMEQNKFMDDMTEYISLIVNEAHVNNGVPKLKFYVIHINYFYFRGFENQEVRYCPAEISLVEFSLEKGIIRSYNKIVNSKIEVGFSCDAKDHSKLTHQIPREPEFGEKDYTVILKDICKFLEPGKINGKFPPLYTRYRVSHIKETVISVLNEFTEIAGSTHSFLVYSLEVLFMILHNVNIKNPSITEIFDTISTSQRLTEDPFDHKKSTACEFHQDLCGGANHCSQSIVQRWTSVLCYFCCPLFDIDLIPGAHTPLEACEEEVTGICNSFGNMKVNVPTSSSVANKGSPNIAKHASERNYKDEKCRRAEASIKPLEIVQHSESSNYSTTATFAASFNPIELDDTNFPSIGRGAGGKRGMKKKPAPKHW